MGFWVTRAKINDLTHNLCRVRVPYFLSRRLATFVHLTLRLLCLSRARNPDSLIQPAV